MADKGSSRGRRTRKAVTPAPSTTSSTTGDPPNDSLLSEEVQEAFLELLSRGASFAVACREVGVGIDVVFETEKRDQRFASKLAQVRRILDQNVEAALYHAALKGNVTAQSFWLKNRPPPGWPDAHSEEEELTDAELVRQAREAGLPIPPELDQTNAPPGIIPFPGSVPQGTDPDPGQ